MSSTAHPAPSRAAVLALQAAAVVALLGSWFVLTATERVSPLILPKPVDVWRELVGLVQEPALWRATRVTTIELLVSFVLAAACGLLMGFLLSRRERVARVAEPLLAWGYIFPFALLFPLFVMWFGAGPGSKIGYAFANSVFPIAYNTMRGLSGVDERYLRVGRAFQASRRQIDWHIKLGAAWPMILSGLRIGGGMVMVTVVLGEVLGADAGLGYEIQQSVNTFQITRSYALIVFLVLLSIVLLWGMERAAKSSRHE